MSIAWIREDLHVHSTFSDGVDSVEENICHASHLGLTRLGCVDHVRRDTEWIPEFVERVREASRNLQMQVLCGVEAKILDQEGRLDCPGDLNGVDRIYVADHCLPLGRECLAPSEVRERLGTGVLEEADVLRALVRSIVSAMERYPGLVLAHLFSFLPKVGMSEGQVPIAFLHRLARTAKSTGSILEVNERWRGPGLRAVRAFLDHGVTVDFGTDSHRAADIGQYLFAEELVLELDEVGWPGVPRQAAVS